MKAVKESSIGYIALFLSFCGLMIGIALVLSLPYVRKKPMEPILSIALTIETVPAPDESPLAADVRKALLYNGDPDYLPATVRMDSVVQYHPRSGPNVIGWASVEMHRGYRAFGAFSDTYLPCDLNSTTNETVRQCAMFNALTTAVNSAWPFDGPPECAVPVILDGAPASFLSRFIGRRLAEDGIKLSSEQVLIITTKRSLEILASDTVVPTSEHNAYCIPVVSVRMEWKKSSVIALEHNGLTLSIAPVLRASITDHDAFLDALRWRLIQELARKNFW